MKLPSEKWSVSVQGPVLGSPGKSKFAGWQLNGGGGTEPAAARTGSDRPNQ